MEEAFDLAREDRLAVTPDLIDCGLKACDVIRLLLEEKAEGAVIPGEVEVTGAFARLLPAPESPSGTRIEESKPAVRVRAAFEIVFKPNREMFYSGADPVTLLDDLRELGQAHITAHADQVPPLAALEAEHCYLWWEILLVTGPRPCGCQGRVRFRRGRMRCPYPAARRPGRGCGPAWLRTRRRHSNCSWWSAKTTWRELKGTRWRSSKTSPRRTTSTLCFGVSTASRAMRPCCWDTSKSTALTDSHPLQLLVRVAHALETLLDPFRGAAAGPVPEATIQTALETCDAIRSLLGRLTHNGEGGPVSPELLERLGVRTHDVAGGRSQDPRDAAFRNTTAQCVEMIASCFRRMENDSESTGPVLQTYLRGLKTLSAAAQYRNCPELEEPLAQQLRILDAAVRTGAALGSEERSVLASAFRAARSVLDAGRQPPMAPTFRSLPRPAPPNCP
jgi:chemotaxis protein histidine kinase CheA